MCDLERKDFVPWLVREAYEKEEKNYEGLYEVVE